MAYLYRNELKDMVGKYTLDSLADRFGSYQAIDETVFSALCNAKPNDPRITALVEFDFEHNMVNVCGSRLLHSRKYSARRSEKKRSERIP